MVNPEENVGEAFREIQARVSDCPRNTLQRTAAGKFASAEQRVITALRSSSTDCPCPVCSVFRLTCLLLLLWNCGRRLTNAGFVPETHREAPSGNASTHATCHPETLPR